MARVGSDRNKDRCALCGKSGDQVKKLILGVYGGVCLDCVSLCNEIIKGEAAQSEDCSFGGIPKPKGEV